VKWFKLTMLTLAAGILIFVFGWVPYWLAGVFTTRRFQYNDKENAGLTPASFDLAFEDVSFQAADGVGLRGWWVPAKEPKGSVVLIHGLNRSRIEMVRKLPFLHTLGWNALLFDLRFHGESGGKMRSLGYYERQDVHAATKWAKEHDPGPVVLWGISFGGATAVLAAAEDPGVSGVVCDSSYRSLKDTARHHLALFRRFRWWLRIVPAWPVADEAVYWFGRRAKLDPDALDIVKAAGRLGPRPALFVANSGDVRMPKEIAFELQAAVGPSAKVLIVPSSSHGGAYRDGTAAYESAVGEFLKAVAGAPQRVANP